LIETEVADLVRIVDEAWRPPLTDVQKELWGVLAEPLDPKLAFRLIFDFERQSRTRPATIDFRAAYKRELRDTTPIHPAQPQDRSEKPDWVRGWQLARAEGDLRLWPEQEQGWHALLYNWEADVAERGIMPQAARLDYIARAKAKKE